ncbi:MAG TPA: lytic murein transglycosylase B [Ideonella sp.]|uniref:lytic murein transglycosylase B n=1 Tax=Ideonella sp. TaxID=1929293 RepID=UPI002E36D3FA|nr:lytic murein transglycosylase B [Ideonella sp.]HEX5683846.1 lytic murein transglycosylase B [Ideonella sp.]
MTFKVAGSACFSLGIAPALLAVHLIAPLGTALAAPVARADSAPDVVTYGRREDLVAFVQQAAERQGFDAEWAIEQLAQARFQPRVAQLVMPPPTGTAKNWEAYRSRFVEPQRIREGLRWWQANERWLDEAEARWGVPPDMVVAIVGVETFYGRIMGSFKVIDALATLSFDFPAGRSDRSGFYRNELEAFLSWCAAEQRDPLGIKGSYAGAMGLPQFMPSTLQKYAIDFDGDGRIDLDANGADVVGSVAHYFAQFGWQRDLPTHFGVTPPPELRDRALMLAPDIVPTFSAEQFAERGARLDDAGRAHDGPMALVMLQNGEAEPSYVAGTRNFYVVTRYNWSSYYAMAVIELARALRQMRPTASAASAASTEPPTDTR